MDRDAARRGQAEDVRDAARTLRRGGGRDAAARGRGSSVVRGFRRQALHAETLEFAHPVSGEPVRVTAPVPADMLALLAALHADTQAQRK